MDDFALVSVILPVYGVEKYISKCLDSVCNQTYRNLEIIIVDDESPDHSGIIADQYAMHDTRIHVIHTENKGAAAARNIGLDYCSGSFVMFVDSDDWIEQDTIEKMVMTIINNESDLVQCQYMNEYTDRMEKQTYIAKDSIVDERFFLSDMIFQWENILIWNKLYRRSIIGDIRFKEGRCIDDEFFTYKIIMNSSKISMITDFLYHYRRRQSSAMGNPAKAKQRNIDQLDFVTERYTCIISNYPELKPLYLQHLMDVIMNVIRNSADFPDIYSRAKKLLCSHIFDALHVEEIPYIFKKSMIAYLIHTRRYYCKKNTAITNKQYGYYE